MDKAHAAADRIRDKQPAVSLEVMPLDLADLGSVRCFAEEYRRRYKTLDILCNNAGVMALPYRRTADGFETQFGVNHLGHFALTGLLIEPILNAPAARVVTVSSAIHWRGKIDFEDLNGERSYNKWGAYAASKLANLLFAYELSRKFEAASARAISVAAHPGYADTALQEKGPRMEGSALMAWLFRLSNRLFAQSAAMGALPILYAATAPGVKTCDYIGPGGLLQQRGYPIKTRSSEASYDPDLALRLWSVSEEMTGVRYALALF
jgi:NAD(P)-dependent dehydrogenase (short-subunit alcohol dehydrogenase family)